MKCLLRQVKLQSWTVRLSLSGRKWSFVAFVISKHVIFQYQQKNKHFLILYMHQVFAFILWVNWAFKERIPLTKANPNECKGPDKLRPRTSGSEPYAQLTALPLRHSWLQLNRQSYRTVYKTTTDNPAFIYDLIGMSSGYFFLSFSFSLWEKNYEVLLSHGNSHNKYTQVPNKAFLT